MKKILFALTVAIAALFLTGCEKRLDIQKKGVISLEDFYQTDADAESALVNVYYQAARWLSNTMGTEAGWNECPLLNPFEYASDDMFAAGSDKADGVEGNQINAFWYDNTNSVITGSYHCYYMIITACNQLLDPFAEAADSQVKKRCVAEARVMRAYMHLILAMGWKNPPLIDHVLDGGDRPENVESQEYLLSWIANECDKAIPDLTERASTADKDGAVRITKGFAYAIKGKALLFKGDKAGAAAALKQVIDSGKYALVPGEQMSSLYHYSGRGNSESVFEFNLKYDATVDGYYQRAQPNFKMLWGWRGDKMNLPKGKGTEITGDNTWGWCNPSKKFVDAILAEDGYDSFRRKAWIKSFDEVLYEMPYTSDGDDFKPGKTDAKEADPDRGIIAADGLYGHVGWFMWKRLYRMEDKTPSGEIQWNLVVMRYSEVLLMYAEAAQDASYIKMVQQRAGVPEAKWVTTYSDNALRNEKFIECWLEGSRFPDLVRWGIAATELADNGKYLPNFCDAMYSKAESKHRGYIDDHDANWCVGAHPDMGFKADKHSYFPIPFAEKNVNPNIKSWNE